MLPVVVFLFFASADFNQQFRAGLVALNGDDLPRARRTLEAASKLRPRNAEVWVALAQTYRKLKSDGLAAAAATRAEQYASSSPAAIHALAVFYMEAGNFEKAAVLESRYAVTDESAFADAAVYWIKANRPKAAIECAQRAVAHEGGSDMHALLAAAYDADGQFPNSAKEYERAIELSPYDESYYFELAQDYLKRQQFEPAAQILERGVKLFDKSAQLELALGVAYYGQRRFSDAADAFLRTLDISPDVDQPYVFLGKMLDQAGDRLPEIVKRFEVWSAANPRDAGAQLLYAKALLATGDRDREAKAEELLRAAISLKEDDWESHFDLGVILENRRKYAEAAAELERSIALDPRQADAHYHLSRVYDRLGQPDRANAERQAHDRLTTRAGIK